MKFIEIQLLVTEMNKKYGTKFLVGYVHGKGCGLTYDNEDFYDTENKEDMYYFLKGVERYLNLEDKLTSPAFLSIYEEFKGYNKRQMYYFLKGQFHILLWQCSLALPYHFDYS